MKKKGLSIIAITLTAVMMLTACGNYSTKTEQVTESTAETESSEDVIVASETETEASESVDTSSTEAASTEESSTEEASTETASTEESSTEEASTEVSAEDTIVTGGHIVVIDPGHQRQGDSTKEPNGPGSSTMKARVTGGTRGTTTGVSEYELTLDIGLQLRDELEGRGYTVYMTRETHDVNISNQERARMMNALGVDLVLRIHCNGSSSPSANGIGLYVNKSYAISAESRRAAECILPRMAEATGARQRGIFLRDTYTGLNWSAVPAILVECGYLTNPGEDEKLNDPAFQQKLAEGMVEGICDYFESLQP